MLKITGLEELSKQLTDVQKALAALDGGLGTVSFNPRDPASIEAAIQQIEGTIEERLADFASNPIVRPIADELKEKYRQAIIDQAAAARMNSGEAK
jgi:hypothetical protein